MKVISETTSLERLDQIKTDLRSEISNFERRAKNCLTCETQGACCLDAHFVNVHISRLEAVSIRDALAELSPDVQDRVEKRIDEAISKYELTADGDTFSRPFACPLFEKSVGCLVHNNGKPVPCIVHACYESQADLPPDELHVIAEQQIDALNTRTYGRPQPWLPLPVAIRRLRADPPNVPA